MAVQPEDEILLAHIDRQKPVLEHNKKVICILEGDLMKYVHESMDKELSDEAFKEAEPRIAPINFLIRIIDKLSKIYQQAPQRTVVEGSDSDTELLEMYIKAFQMDPTMNVGNEMFNAFKTNLNQPYVDNDGMPRLRVIPNDRFTVYSNDMIDQTRPTHVALPWGQNVVKTVEYDNRGRISEVEKSVKLFKVYTDDEVYLLDEVGNRSIAPSHPDGVNPFGTLPFMYANESRLFLIPPPDSDTLRMSILLAKLVSDLNYAVKFQSFSVVWGVDIDDAEMKMAPNAFWRLKSDPVSDKSPQLGQIKPQVDIAAVIQLITTELSMWLNSRNIRPGSVSDISAQNMVSGISKLVDEMDTSDERKKQTEIYKAVEEKFWMDLMHKIHPVWVSQGIVKPEFQRLFSQSAKVEVEFTEQLPLLRRGQIVTDLKNEFEAGFISRETAIRKLNPEWSDKRLDEELELMGVEATITDDMDSDNEDDQSMFTGSTSTENGHSHQYNIDRDGNGSTSLVDGHSHTITNGNVAESDGHTHTIGG